MKEHVFAKILRWFIYGAAFMPLIIFNDFISPFHFGKVVVFRSIVELMVVFYILLIWKDGSYLPKMTRVSWAFFFFACAFTLTAITSVIPYISAWGSLERMGGAVTFWHYFVYFIILISVFKNEKDWIRLFDVMIFAGVLSAFYGFGQRTNIDFFIGSGGRERIFGTIGNPALFAGYQILLAFLSGMFIFKSGISKNFRIFYGSSALIMFIAAFMTVVRGSILGICVGFLTFALLYSSAYRSQKAKKILLTLIALAAVFVVAALLLKNTPLVQNSGYLKRITNFSLTDQTVKTRFWAWQAGLKGWKEGPKTILLGWGPENFDVPFSKYFNPKFFSGPGAETLFDRAHNMFVEILVTMGLLGLGTYIWIFISSFQSLWKNIHNKDTTLYGVGFISLLIAYVIHNSFIFDTSANFLVFFTILGFISYLSVPKTVENKKPIQRRVNQGLWVMTGAALFVTSFICIYMVNIQTSLANYASTRGIIAGWAKDFPAAVAKFQEATSYDAPGKYEYRNRYAQFIIENVPSQINQTYIDATLDAAAQVQKNIDENKPDYLPYLYEARLYVTLGKDDDKSPYNDKSLEYSMAALKISPTFIRTYYEIGQAYLNKKDYDNAAKYFKEAAQLNPDAGISSWYWGVVEIQRGNVDLGLSILENIIETHKYGPAEPDLQKLLSLYEKKGDLARIVWVSEMLVANYPDNGQYHATLAVAYAKAGMLDKAVEQAHAAATVDDKYTAEAQAFVKSIGRQW